ncbi:DUF6518 family protein [Actinomadura oligospora]|uniref:DUF6518 family protein n=1 Tax=Actinomadura oligospora TaxID=111804 RepID=UPI0004BB4A4C|nr:DUF6518 family protein [Actinomadura oligospora]
MTEGRTGLVRARALGVALVVGAGFGAATSLLNGLSAHFADLDSRAATTHGASPLEIASTLLDSGWAWAGLAVALGWLVTRSERDARVAMLLGAAAGALSLIAATTTYSMVDAVRGAVHWYESEPVFWYLASVVFGIPLGLAGVWTRRPTVVGLLARLTVPVGALMQMVVVPPGRNLRIVAIGQLIVVTAAIACIVLVTVTWRRGVRGRGAV